MDTPAGTTGNDTFTATGATLGAQDVIAGGAGTDKLVITDTTSASAAGLAAATITGVEALELNSNGGVGAFLKAGTAAGNGQAEVDTLGFGTTATLTATKYKVTINGVTYESASVAGGTGRPDAAATVRAIIDSVLGGNVTTTTPDSTTGAFTVTGRVGVNIPEIEVVASAAGGATVTTTDTQSAVEKVLATGAEAQIVSWTFGGTVDGTDKGEYLVYVDGISQGSTGEVTSLAAGTSAVKGILDSVLGTGFASNSSTTVNVAAKVAGTPLPVIQVLATKGKSGAVATATYSEARANADAVVADTAAVVYNAAAFTEAFTANGAGDMNVKAAATTAVKLANTSGGIVVDTAKTVDITTTGSGTTDVTGKTLESVSIKGGGNVTVDNLLNTSAGTSAAGTSMTTATLNGIAGTTAALKGAALSTVNITSQTSALTTTITNGTSKALTLNLTAAGYNSAGSAQTNRVDAGAAAEAITVNTVSKSNVDVRGAAVTALTLTGAGELTADVSNLATRSITSTATGDLILGSLNSATKTVNTGAGADSFTVGATTKDVAVSTGAGNDAVTIGQLVAGAAVNLGEGNDKILGTGVVEARTVADPGMIDGGAGSDTVSSLLINSGNASRFTNFEVLGLATASASFDASLVSGLTGLELLVANSGVYTGVTKEQGLAVNADIGTGSTTLTFGASNVVGTADSYTVTFGGKGASTSTATSRTNIDGGTLVVEGIEHVNIVSNQASGFVDNIIDLTSARLKTVTITGNSAETTLGFTGTVGTNGSTAGSGGAVSLIDASTYAGIVTVSTAGITADDSATGLTVNTGSGRDVITLRHLTTVNAGSGNDTINLEVSAGTYNSANSVLTGGAGNDAFDVSAAVFGTHASNDSIAEIIVTITDFTAGDTIDFSASTEDAETLGAAVSTATATTLDGAITAIIVGAGTTHFAWGVYGGNTYVVHNADKASGGADTAAEAGDVVVKLSGVLDLSLAAFSTGGVMSLA